MKQIGLNTIKAQNIKLLFDIIVNNDKITRNDAARLSNLSLMTVCNIVDHLDRFGIIHHVDKEQANTVGRKAELLSINKDIKRFIIIDLTSLEFSFTILNLDLTIHNTFKEWRYNFERNYTDNLEDFLLITDKYINTHFPVDETISIGVVVPGPYDVENDIVINKRIPELMQLNIKSIISETLIRGKYIEDDTLEDNILETNILEDYILDIFIDEDVKFAAQANITTIPDYTGKIIYYAYIGEGVGGAISVNGSILRGLFSFAGDIGQVLADENTCFEELISLKAFAREVAGNDNITGSDEDIMKMLEDYQADTDNFHDFRRRLMDFCKRISSALYNVIWFIDPHAIIIECRYAGLDHDFFIEGIKTMLTQMLLPIRQDIPEIFLSNHIVKNAHVGAGILLRNRWLKSIS
ncbi:MAG TPA: ROK family protein [Clostridiales bacterium]|nr:ROK family protein [Clostridiales bacterium]